MAFNIVAGVNNAVYGSVSGSGSYVEGAEVTLEVTANDGYRFVSWDDGNTDNPRIFTASEDVTLVATLESIPEYTISVTVNDNSLGTVSGFGTFREGTSTQISATPYIHSRFVNWEDGNSDNPRTIAVGGDSTYKAIFEAVNYFTISTDVNDVNLGSVTGAGEYDEGDTVTLTAVPETDCRFVSWNDGVADNPRIFISSADVTYTATFEEIQYTDVTIASNDVSWGTVSGATSGNIETGTTITLTATPATDYKFDGWQVDGDIVSASPTASFLVDGQEMDIIAVFSAIVFYQVTLITNDIECGSISVVSATEEPRGTANNIWPDGTIINLRAVTTEGGKFLNWSTGQVATEITVNVHGNETIRANFYPATGLILITKKIFQHAWNTIKSFFSASTGASKIGAPANNALGATTLADVVNSVGQPGGIAMLNDSGKVAAADIDGTLSNDTSGNAATASVADKVGTATVGSSTEPVYINAGTPTACGGSLDVDITGNAATSSSVCHYVASGDTLYPCLLSDVAGTDPTVDQTRPSMFSNKFLVNPFSGEFRIGETTVNSTTYPKVSITNEGDWREGIRVYPTIGADNKARSALFLMGGDVTSESGTTADSFTMSNDGGVFSAYYGVYNTTTSGVYVDKSNPGIGFYNGSSSAKTLLKPTNTSSSTINISLPSTAGNLALVEKTYDDTTNTSYRGMRGLDGSTSGWVRTTSSGIIPSQSGAAGSGHCGLGTSSWYFATAYIDNIYGKLNGNCTGSSASCTGNAATATKAAITVESRNTWHSLVGTTYNATSGTAYGLYRFNYNNSRPDVGIYIDSDATSGNQRVILNLGNSIANTTAAGKNGMIQLWGTGTTSTCIVAGNPSSTNTVTLPTGTGTLALTSSNITGSSASCTGNAATATSATTATNANNIKTTSTAGAWKDIIGVDTGFTSAANKAVHGHNSGSLSFYVDANATSGNQRAILRLGNATANTTAAGHNGLIWLYGTNTGYTEIKAGHNSTGAITLTLPSSTGTLALTSQIPTSAKTTLVDLLAVLHKTTTAISSVSSYTASSDCIIRIRIGDVYWWKIFINSTLYQHQERNNGDSAVTEYVYLVLKNGDVVTASTSGASTYKFSGTVYAI